MGNYWKDFFRKNGTTLALFLLFSVGFWIFMMIVLPQVFMLDFSFRANVPPPKWGTEAHHYTTEHYRYMLYGSAQSTDSYNYVDLSVFGRTILAAIFVTLIDLALCYPVAYYLAHVAKGGWSRLMVMSLIVPFWVNELLRAFAFKIMFGSTGIVNSTLMFLGIIDQPYDFIRNSVALYSGLCYAYILLMIFPIYNAVESLDKNQIEAARDLGSPLVAYSQTGRDSPCQTGHHLRLYDGIHAHRRRSRCAPDSRWPEQPLVYPDYLSGIQPGGQLGPRFRLRHHPAGRVHHVRLIHDAGVQGQTGRDREMTLTADHVRKFFVLFFVLGFFLYLFGPLIIMSITSFNSSAFPRISPFECFSVEWFRVLANDDKLVEGLRNSFIIGIGVVLLAVPLGLSGALMLTQVKERVRPWYYTIVISPILVPGVVLGISTLLFWDRVGTMFGASRDSIFYNGFFLTIIGQATFISAYTMLVFISRLQRFDRAQEEAALDLGATHVQTFRKILLPFLKPAIASAAVLAFLASFENYNTTVFTIISESTLTTFLASKVRHGINPSISALAVVIVLLTLFGAALHEVLKRREAAAEKDSARVAKGEQSQRKKAIPFIMDPAVIMIILVFVAGIGTAYFSGTIGVEECKAQVKAEKLRLAQERIKKREAKSMFQNAPAASQAASEQIQTIDRSERAGVSNFQGVFDTGNLQEQVGGQAGDQGVQQEDPEDDSRTGTENFNSIFDPQNLNEQVNPDQQ